MIKQVKGLQLFRNFSFLVVGKILGDAFTFLFFVVLSRIFGQEGIGQYSFAMALTGFFAVLADFGFYHLSIKEISRHTMTVGKVYGKIFVLRVGLSCIALILLLLMLFVFPFSSEIQLVIILIGGYQVLYTLVDGFGAIFVAQEEMHFAALLEFSFRSLGTLLGILLAIWSKSLVITIAILPVISLLQVVVAYGFVIKKYGKFSLAVSWGSLMQQIGEALPYVLSEFLRQLGSRVDVILLGLFLGTVASGIYNMAYRIIFLLEFLPYFASIALFPLASKWYINAREDLRRLYHTALQVAILLGLPVAAGLWLIAPQVIGLLFGEGFVESVSILRFLAWLFFLSCLKHLLGIFLTSCDRQANRTQKQWIAAWINVLGNISLIPLFGIRGAAIATLLSEALLVGLCAVELKSIFGIPHIGSRLLISSIATISFCLVFTLFSLSLSVVIPVSIGLYIGILALFKDIRHTEFVLLFSLFKVKSHILSAQVQKAS